MSETKPGGDSVEQIVFSNFPFVAFFWRRFKIKTLKISLSTLKKRKEEGQTNERTSVGKKNREKD